MKYIEVRSVAVVTFAVGEPEEDIAVKQVGAVSNRTYGAPEEDVV